MFLEHTNQHIIIISEESSDIEDWSYDIENSALHPRNKLHFKICYFNLMFKSTLLIK